MTTENTVRARKWEMSAELRDKVVKARLEVIKRWQNTSDYYYFKTMIYKESKSTEPEQISEFEELKRKVDRTQAKTFKAPSVEELKLALVKKRILESHYTDGKPIKREHLEHYKDLLFVFAGWHFNKNQYKIIKE